MEWGKRQTFPSVHTRVFSRAIAIHGGSLVAGDCTPASMPKLLFGLTTRSDFTGAKSTTDDVGPPTLVDMIFNAEGVVSSAITDRDIF